MMRQPTRCTATDALKPLAPLLALLALLCATSPAFAAAIVGNVANLSGPLVAKRADGTAKILSVKSSVEQGDLLVTEKDTYARIRFIDNSEMTLRPNTQFKIDNFVYDEQKKESDKAEFSLVKGGLRAVTGALGKRSKERFGLNTPTATIGIRGTIFIAEYVAPDTTSLAAWMHASVASADDGAGPVEPLQLAALDPAPGPPAARLPGLYVQVIEGIINLTNPGGSQNFSAGQFGFVPSMTTPPIILPANPGMQFTPPPAFNSSQAGGDSTSAGKAFGNVDCEVR